VSISKELTKIRIYQSWAVKQIYGVNSFVQYLVFIFGLPLLGKYFRFRALLNNLEIKDIKSKKILDVGSGLGEISILLSHGNYLTSLDLNLEFLKVQNLYALLKDFDISTFDYDLNNINILRDAEKFDFIIALSVIDYIREPMIFLSNLTSCLNKGGKLIISYPKMNRIISKNSMNLTFKSPIHQGFDVSKLDNFFHSQNLYLVSQKSYMPFNLFYVHDKISQKFINYKFLNRFITLFSYIVFLIIYRLIFFIPSKFDTEIFQIWQKND
jgi:2-polyprenyl-3-methyl-5-hydroxy-6-metoxy-1,4-benzoquinol methylase